MLELNLDTTEKIVSLIAGVIAIGGGLAVWRRRRSKAAVQAPVVQQNSSVSGNNQNVSFNISAPISPPAVQATPGASIADLKRSTNILFVDDDRGFKIVGILKKMGWEHTKLVADISSLEQPALIDSHVIFVDIQGVGKAMQYADEGLGLALAIKRRHSQKKVVIYSAEETGARFHEALQEADYSLPKTAEPIRFEDTIVRVLSK